MISIANEAQLLVEEYWDKDDFTRMFPPVAFPAQIKVYVFINDGRKSTTKDEQQWNWWTQINVSDEEEKKRLLKDVSKLESERREEE